MVHLLYDWDLAASEREFRRALELDPEYTTAHHWYSHCLLVIGRTDESLAESKRALELEPLHLVIGLHLGWHYLYARQYDQAIEQFRKTLELDPAFPPAQRCAAWAYLQKGMRQEAIASLRAEPSTSCRNWNGKGSISGRRVDRLRGSVRQPSARYTSWSRRMTPARRGPWKTACGWKAQ